MTEAHRLHFNEKVPVGPLKSGFAPGTGKVPKEKGLKAGFIITTVGCLEKVTLRLEDQNSASSFSETFEIVSLVGTLSQDGVHLHVALSDSTGKTIGGHFV